MEWNEPVHSGFLLLPPVGISLLKKTWQQKHCLLYKASKFGIQRLEIYDILIDSKKSTPTRIITLENCIKISSSSDTNFIINTKSSPCVHEFGTLDVQMKHEWLDALQSVAFPDDTSKITSVEEDNELYCSSNEGVFIVKIHQSPASTRCGLDARKFILVLTTSAIQLRNLTDSSLLYTWPYCFIRRYGYKSGKFTFEAGRKCESGEGTFFLEHSNQQEIFRCLASKMKSMKQYLKDTSNGLLDCGDNQFQAALSMEARSRSPLPPSPTTSTAIHDIDTNLSGKSQLTTGFTDSLDKTSIVKPKPNSKPLNSSWDQLHHAASSMEVRSRNSIPPSPTESMSDSDGIMLSTESILTLKSNLKPVPAAKPCSTNNKNNNTIIDSGYETINKYDEVEYRNDAWRTLGLDEINHTENRTSFVEDDYMTWGTLGKKSKKPDLPPQNTKAPKIITQPPKADGPSSYDTLVFFGSSTKLSVKSGYKQVTPAPTISQPTHCPPSFNEYDEVQPALEGVRIADDSHLGYALVRKEPAKREVVSHLYHNNEPYAMINSKTSKTKRV